MVYYRFQAGEWVKENTDDQNVKVHWDPRKDWEVVKFVKKICKILCMAVIVIHVSNMESKQIFDYLLTQKEEKCKTLNHAGNKGYEGEIEEINLSAIDDYKMYDPKRFLFRVRR